MPLQGSPLIGGSMVGNRSMQGWAPGETEASLETIHPCRQGQPTRLPGDRVYSRLYHLHNCPSQIQNWRSAARVCFSPSGYSGTIAHPAGLEGMKLLPSWCVRQDLSRCECGRNGLLWRPFSVKHLSLYGGGGGVGKDYINLGVWVGVFRVSVHYWLGHSGNASFA